MSNQPLIKGSRVMAHDWRDVPLGTGTIVWAGPVYLRVVMDATGRKVVVRRDKCKEIYRLTR